MFHFTATNKNSYDGFPQGNLYLNVKKNIG